jgi:hypothetical protein
LNKLPLLIVGRREHLHSGRERPEFKDSLQDLLSFSLQIPKSRADKHLIPTLVRSGHSHIRSSILPERDEFRGQGNLVTCQWTIQPGAVLIGSYRLWGTKIGQGVRPA